MRNARNSEASLCSMNFQYPKFRSDGARDRLRFGGDRFEPANQRQCRGRRYMFQRLHAAQAAGSDRDHQLFGDRVHAGGSASRTYNTAMPASRPKPPSAFRPATMLSASVSPTPFNAHSWPTCAPTRWARAASASTGKTRSTNVLQSGGEALRGDFLAFRCAGCTSLGTRLAFGVFIGVLAAFRFAVLTHGQSEFRHRREI